MVWHFVCNVIGMRYNQMEKEIVILAAKSQDELEKGADVEERNCLTVAEAKRRAKYFLTEEYRVASESSERLGYSQVLVNNECVADYFGDRQ
jgi:hypothetical protein